MRRFLFVLLLALAAVSFQDVAAQCPMCKTSLEANRKDESVKKVGNGINKGILYLLAMPFVLAGTVGGAYLYRTRKS